MQPDMYTIRHPMLTAYSVTAALFCPARNRGENPRVTSIQHAASFFQLDHANSWFHWLTVEGALWSRVSLLKNMEVLSHAQEKPHWNVRRCGDSIFRSSSDRDVGQQSRRGSAVYPALFFLEEEDVQFGSLPTPMCQHSFL